jgi:hypothetical protein
MRRNQANLQWILWIENTESAVDIPLPNNQYIQKFCLFSVPAPSFFSVSSGTVGFFHFYYRFPIRYDLERYSRTN